MALIIETGAGVADAESYITVAEARAFALNRGVTLSSDDSAVEILARKAADYLETFRSAYTGVRVSGSQSLQWPRKEAVIEDNDFPEDEIPAELKKAQSQAVMDIASGLDPLPNSTGRAVLKEKVDVIEVEYADSGSAIVTPSLPKVMSYLEPLFGNNGFSSVNVPLIHA